jgi:hypothetical protein
VTRLYFKLGFRGSSAINAGPDQTSPLGAQDAAVMALKYEARMRVSGPLASTGTVPSKPLGKCSDRSYGLDFSSH